MSNEVLRALQPMLHALRINQRISFDEAQTFLQEMHQAIGRSVWPGLSGNDVCVFANLVLARYNPARGIEREARASEGPSPEGEEEQT